MNHVEATALPNIMNPENIYGLAELFIKNPQLTLAARKAWMALKESERSAPNQP